MKTKRISYTLLPFILLSLIFVGSFKIIFFSFIIFLVLTYIIINNNDSRTNVLYVVIEVILLLLLNSGRITDFTSRLMSLDYQQLIEQIKMSKHATILFAIIQLLQVVVLPIPAQITTISGVVVFGFLRTFCISCIMCILGSIINFILGRIFNNKLIHYLKIEQTAKKYQTIFKNKTQIILATTFLLPIFPDDIICYIAGTTDITIWQFIRVVIITRPIGILATCLFGSSTTTLLLSYPIITFIIIIVSVTIYLLFKLLHKYRPSNKNTDYI